MRYLREFDLDFGDYTSKPSSQSSDNNSDNQFIPFDLNNDEEVMKQLLAGNYDEYYKKINQTNYPFTPNPQRIQFRRETRCITSLYENFFPKTKTKDCWKVEVQCVKEIFREKVIVVGGVAEVQALFDVEQFFSLSDEEKKKLALETLKKGIDLVIKEFGWDPEPFESAYNKVIEYKYTNLGRFGKPKSSPNRKYKAEVICQHDISSFDISIVIRDKNGEEIKRELMKSEEPDEFLFARHLGNFRWVSSDEVELRNKFETEIWRVKV